MGCVSQAGEQSTNVGGNAVLAPSLPESVPGTSIDRRCGSSQHALRFSAQAVMSGTMDHRTRGLSTALGALGQKTGHEAKDI